jgi:hypothetical protein
LMSLSDTARLSCNKCIELGFGAKNNGCPQCLPPFLGIKLENSSCQKWTEDRREGGKASDIRTSWLFGFVSGYNAYAPGTLSKPKPMFFYYDEQNILKKIDHSCAASPRESVVKIVLNFISSMQKP